MKENESSDKTVYQMEPTGHGDGEDAVPRADITDPQMLRTLAPRERVLVLEQIRYHGVQENQHRVRRQRYEKMLRHDNYIKENDTLEPTKTKEENINVN